MSSQIGAIVSVNALMGRILKQPMGDLADRLNSRITVCVLALTSAFLVSTHIWGEPITCWTPAQFTKAWTDFVNQYCYVHGTYFVPLDKGLDFDATERRRFPITYYQWVPYVMAVQALLYYLPRLIWKCFCTISGYDLIGAIRHMEHIWDEVRGNEDKFKARMTSFEKQSAVYIWDGILLARRKQSYHLALYYVAFTALQTLNAWLQFVWLNELLQSATYSFWGPSIILDLYRGIDWQISGHFPRITHCDFSRRRPASIQLDTVLCVLHLNIYYEKLFLFLWFWMFFVAMVSTANFFFWTISTCVTRTARRTIIQYLNEDNRTSVEHFLRLLGNDGLFIVQQISINIGDLPASYLTRAMKTVAETWDIAVNDGLEGRSLLQKGNKAV
uniref:Innexin n=1 Tax=Ascaris suum TaxID=6253 RepID=F1L5G5_ASCSU